MLSENVVKGILKGISGCDTTGKEKKTFGPETIITYNLNYHLFIKKKNEKKKQITNHFNNNICKFHAFMSEIEPENASKSFHIDGRNFFLRTILKTFLVLGYIATVK